MQFYLVKVMKQSLRYIGLLAILPLVMVALSPDLISEVDAQKSEGSDGAQSPKSYGSATNKVVCGDKLCDADDKSEPANISRIR